MKHKTKRSKRMRKIAAFLTAAVLMVSMLSVGALADGDEAEETIAAEEDVVSEASDEAAEEEQTAADTEVTADEAAAETEADEAEDTEDEETEVLSEEAVTDDAAETEATSEETVANDAAAEGEGTTTSSVSYTGQLYHIDIRVAGTFTYTLTESTELSNALKTVSKVWVDEEEVDHSSDVVTVYLLDENGDRITDSSGNDVSVALSEDNDWTYDLSSLGYTAYEVEEEAFEGYTVSYTYGTEGLSSESTTLTGTITVTGINDVSYTTNGTTYNVNTTYTQQTSESSEYPYEFFMDESDRQSLANFYDSSTVTVNLTYTYSYVDEDGVTRTGTATDDFTFTASRSTNTCAYVTGEKTATDVTMYGYDAVISASALGSSVAEILNGSATITNTTTADADSESDADDDVDADDTDDTDDSEDVEEVESTDTGDPGVLLWAVVLGAAICCAVIGKKRIAR